MEDKYCREITKSEKCEPRDEAPLTISSLAKAQGKVTLFELKVNNTLIADKELENILIEKGNFYAQLKRETESGLFALFQSNNIEVKFVTVTELKVGSLIVDYIVEFYISHSEVTLQSLNPVKYNRDIFLKDSPFNAKTSPKYSEISGIYLYFYFIICIYCSSALNMY